MRVAYIPSISLKRLDKLGWRIVVRDVEPQAMGNSSWGTFSKTERVTTDKVCTFSVWIIEGVKEMWSGWCQEVLNVLLKRIDIFPRWVFGNLNIKTEDIRE